FTEVGQRTLQLLIGLLLLRQRRRRARQIHSRAGALRPPAWPTFLALNQPPLNGRGSAACAPADSSIRPMA
ncbi:TPA: hypothetical protein ACQDSG_005100, partial [Serratia marcescens]